MKALRPIFLLLSLFALTAIAKSPKRSAPAPGEQSQKELDFDGDVVEGMNRQPLDSLTTNSEGDGGGSKNHLYRRKKNFKPENRDLARSILETY